LWALPVKAAPPGQGQGQKVHAPAGHALQKIGHSTRAAARKAEVRDLQVYSGKDYSRIVLVLSGQARRHWQVLPADSPDNPDAKAQPDPAKRGVRRLYVDLEDTVIGAGVPRRFDVRGEVARKVRLSYFKPDVARLVVEVADLKEQHVFELDNPDRVIVDVKSQASALAQTQTPIQSPASTPAEQAAVQPEKARPAGKGRPGVRALTVMVDAGRGGRDFGAAGPGGLKEKTVTLKVAGILAARLAKMGFQVLETRTTDTFIPQEKRTAMANARQADLFISIHCNADANRALSGLETYSLNLASTPDEVREAARENSVDPRNISDMQDILDDLLHASKLNESRELARCAHEATLSQARKCLPLTDRGVHEAPFYVLLGARMPAILVELGYLSNPSEAAKLEDEKYLEALAAGLADGVKAYAERVGRTVAGN
jgi:N-acetylmuramoyl-L-alanine amidase